MSMRLLRCRPRAPRAGTTSGRRLLLLAVTTMGLALPACSGGLGTYFAPTAAVVGGAKIPEDAVITQLKVVASQAQFSNLFQGPKSNLNRVDAKVQILSQLVQQQAVVNEAHGTGRRAPVEGVPMALKTGTAGDKKSGLEALILAVAPVDAPKIAFGIIAEDAGPAEFAGAKIAHDFVERLKGRL